jgi:nucleoside phosphorylase
MEGFAVLRAAALAGVRAIEIRGISNRCGDRANGGWNFAAGIAGLEKIAAVFFERCAAITQA